MSLYWSAVSNELVWILRKVFEDASNGKKLKNSLSAQNILFHAQRLGDHVHGVSIQY